MALKLVSVIVNCYNSEKYLREAIDSIYNQTYNNYEIILLDNASNDKTEEIAKSYSDLKMKYFRTKNTIPLGAARNEALDHAEGDYIAFLDSDDIWEPDKIEKQIILIEGRKEAAASYTNALYFSESKANEEYRLYSTMQPSGKIFSKLLINYNLCLSTVMIRRSALELLSEVFDDSLEVAEEADLFIRLSLENEFLYLPETLTRYRMHSESVSNTSRHLFSTENRIILEKIRRMDKSVIGPFSDELKIFEATIFYTLAIQNVIQDRRKIARKILKPFIWIHGRSFYLYAISFLPVRHFLLLKNIFGKPYST
jgi:glycosyltransferase involved in cell wall biosynthesis